jgi:multiple sugar transport system permease protein
MRPSGQRDFPGPAPTTRFDRTASFGMWSRRAEAVYPGPGAADASRARRRQATSRNGDFVNLSRADVSHSEQEEERRARRPIRVSNAVIAAAFLAPAVIMLIAVTLYPIGFALVISLFEWNLTAREPAFVGLNNFAELFTQPAMLHSLRVTIFFTLVSTLLSFAIGLGVALLLNRPLFGIRVARALVLLPIMMSPVVVGFIFQMMFHADYGIVNYLLYDVFHIIDRKLVWLGDPWLALGTVIATDVWLGVPFVAIILLAGLQSLDSDPFEAATIDGASRWQMFRDISWPLLKNPIMVAVTIRTIVSARTFDLIYTLTQGGPIGFTEVLSFQAFRQGLEFFRVGYGSAAAVLLIAVSLGLVGAVTFVFNRITH